MTAVTSPIVRRVALTAAVVGAAASLGLVLYAGRRNDSLILTLLFTVWVLSPYVAALRATMIARGWLALTQKALYAAILIFTLGALAIYGSCAFGLLRLKTGFVFLVVPFASWVLMAVFGVSARISERKLRGAGGRW